MFDVKEFINKVDVKRTCEGDDCEFEVTEDAMNLYCLKYPCYVMKIGKRNRMRIL